MNRICCIWICVFVWIIQTQAQVQTLHNTLAKGTLNITGGANKPNFQHQDLAQPIDFSAGVNYCFKHHYTLGLEVSMPFAGVLLQRNDLLFKTQLGKFKITSIVGINGGTLFSKSTFNTSGFYVSGEGGLRFEFYRLLFLELKESGGYTNKNNVEIRTKYPTKITSEGWFTNTQIKLGIFMFINTLDKCGTCPKW
jgi:hypothetical protein